MTSDGFRKAISILLRTIILVAILAVGIGGTLYMVMHRITPDRAPAEEQITPVTVGVLTRSAEKIRIEAQGTVTPARQVHIRPEVTGRIVEMNDRLIPGGYFPGGALMVRIDSRDYEAQVAVRKDQIVQAGVHLKQEQARQAVAHEEWDLLGSAIPEDRANRELALRIPQIESAESALAAARSALAKAELDIERCTIRAPFNALVIQESVDPGQVVNPQTEIAVLAGTDEYWVRVSVPVEYLPWIDIPKEGSKGSPVTITQKTGAGDIARNGEVVRLLGDLDPNGRLARLLVSIDDPLNLEKNRGRLPLLLGSYVSVGIAGRTMRDVMVVPRNAVRTLESGSESNGRDREGVWIMGREDRLRIEPVEVVWRTQDSVFVTSELPDGSRIVTSNIPTPVTGMKLAAQPGGISEASVPEAEK